MNYTILYQGVLLGTVELTPEATVGEFVATPAYASVHPVIRAASEVLWAAGMFTGGAMSPTPLDTSALGRANNLPLELRDPYGALVGADFVNIVERPDPADLPVAFVRFRHAASGVPSSPPHGKRNGAASARVNGRGDR